MSVVFLLTAIVLVVVGGLLTAISAALGAVGRNELIDLAATKRKPKAVHALAAGMPAHERAVRFVRVVVESIAAVLLTLAVSSWLDQWWEILLVTGVLLIGISFVVVGSSPRSVGQRHAIALVGFFAGFVHAIRTVVGPLAELLIVVGNIVTPGSGGAAVSRSEDQLRNWVDEAADQDMLEDEDRELIHSIFELGDTIVREVMVARTDMVTVEGTSSVNETMDIFLETGVSRIPVIGKDSDDVVGICYLRDVARVQHEKPASAKKTAIAALAKPAVFIPESKKVDETLRFLQREQNHLAMVVDEYGGIAGLVTMEDLIEELVGEISDEYDLDVNEILSLGADSYKVAAKYSLDDLADLYDIDIDEDDVDTVGGLLTKLVGRLPEADSMGETSDLRLVAEAPGGRNQRVSWIRVYPTAAWLEKRALREEIEQARTGEIPLP
ncbi:hemolysin family protein [Pontimonas sp.]|nr:hemolysin family protein [Pontimonas sp.]